MKNKAFWILLFVVGLIFALLAWGALVSVQEVGLANPVGAVCAVAFLLVAFVAWEVLMKPGYMFRLRRPEPREGDEAGERGPPGEPPSSRPP